MLTSVRLARLMRGQSLNRMAEEVGVNHTFLSKVERRWAVPSPGLKQRILDFFPGVAAETLFDETGLARALKLGDASSQAAARQILDASKGWRG